jgi:hypothetical protein
MLKWKQQQKVLKWDADAAIVIAAKQTEVGKEPTMQLN